MYVCELFTEASLGRQMANDHVLRPHLWTPASCLWMRDSHLDGLLAYALDVVQRQTLLFTTRVANSQDPRVWHPRKDEGVFYFGFRTVFYFWIGM